VDRMPSQRSLTGKLLSDGVASWAGPSEPCRIGSSPDRSAWILRSGRVGCRTMRGGETLWTSRDRSFSSPRRR
jgi:hypothetical protein